VDSGTPTVSVTHEGGHAFVVEVRDADGSTTHTVEVPNGLADRLGWGGADEADLVRESFAFLLEREPPTSILQRFSLEVIGRYFPEYPREMRRRSGGHPAPGG
jgi:hypothetical protein